ncbi:ATP-dependent Clp protease adapter ClpS [Pollutimonas thiosulfatoxidans]|uniref:ATP-dependent Clp protease adapter protein ClpS n=1 Tax=Pollutimonas thiosulfatoxidans TaxID=2028345 RepID=A0A410G9U9_9BURK|nr:ATP-dependent Clp protease adapter ClpS [Pollutimonas thiosulfatoxidans]MBF6616046.1 ATP-dependent Clp protease adapter ClpS [Candidimonas sp.]NYT45022.1 ATP-dependent Clp protease adapter ClpS [Alcaligenaceae bacterium]QAA93066.1 ATP-dependent Clp protease adapter ClpS [Pollutimonas thiosulfatoxidans]
MATQIDNQRDTVLDRQPAKLAPPPMYQVILLNDDYTPMEFVVVVLQRIFGKSEDEAARIMLKVHHEGRAVCGVYPRDIAATRVEMVRQMAQARQHPLQCLMEPAPDA